MQSNITQINNQPKVNLEKVREDINPNAVSEFLLVDDISFKPQETFGINASINNSFKQQASAIQSTVIEAKKDSGNYILAEVDQLYAPSNMKMTSLYTSIYIDNLAAKCNQIFSTLTAPAPDAPPPPPPPPGDEDDHIPATPDGTGTGDPTVDAAGSVESMIDAKEKEIEDRAANGGYIDGQKGDPNDPNSSYVGLSPQLQKDYEELMKLWNIMSALATVAEGKRGAWRAIFQMLYDREPTTRDSDTPISELVMSMRQTALQKLQLIEMELSEAIEAYNQSVYTAKVNEAKKKAEEESGWWDSFKGSVSSLWEGAKNIGGGIIHGDWDQIKNGFNQMSGEWFGFKTVFKEFAFDGLGDVFTYGEISKREYDANFKKSQADIDKEKADFDAERERIIEEALLKIIKHMEEEENEGSPVADGKKKLWFGDSSSGWGGINSGNMVNKNVDSKGDDGIGVGGYFLGSVFLPNTILAAGGTNGLNGDNIVSIALSPSIAIIGGGFGLNGGNGGDPPPKWDIDRDRILAARMRLVGLNNIERAYYTVKEAIEQAKNDILFIMTGVKVGEGYFKLFDQMLADLQKFELELFSIMVNTMVQMVTSHNTMVDSFVEAQRAQSMLTSVYTGTATGGFIFAYGFTAINDYLTSEMLDAKMTRTYNPSQVNMDNVYAILRQMGDTNAGNARFMVSDGDPNKQAIMAMQRGEELGWKLIAEGLYDNAVIAGWDSEDGFQHINEKGVADLRVQLEGIHDTMRAISMIGLSKVRTARYILSMWLEKPLMTIDNSHVEALEQTFRSQELGFELKLSGIENKVREHNRLNSWKRELEAMSYKAWGASIGMGIAAILIVVTWGAATPFVIVGIAGGMMALGAGIGSLLYESGHPINDQKLPGEDTFYPNKNRGKTVFDQIDRERQNIIDGLNENNHVSAGDGKWGTDVGSLATARENLTKLRFAEMALLMVYEAMLTEYQNQLANFSGVGMNDPNMQILHNAFSEQHRTKVRTLNDKQDYISDRIMVHNRKREQDKAIERGWIDTVFGAAEAASSIGGMFVKGASTAFKLIQLGTTLGHIATNLYFAIYDKTRGAGDLDSQRDLELMLDNIYKNTANQFDSQITASEREALQQMNRGMLQGVGGGNVAPNAGVYYAMQTRITNLYNIYLALAIIKQAQSRIFAKLGNTSLAQDPLSQAIYDKRDASLNTLKLMYQRVKELAHRLNELNDLTKKMYVTIGTSALSTFLALDKYCGGKIMKAAYNAIKSGVDDLVDKVGGNPNAKPIEVIKDSKIANIFGENWDGKISYGDIAAVLTKILVSNNMLSFIIEKAYDAANSNKGDNARKVDPRVSNTQSNDKFTQSIANLENDKASYQQVSASNELSMDEREAARKIAADFNKFIIGLVHDSVNALGWGRDKAGNNVPAVFSELPPTAVSGETQLPAAPTRVAAAEPASEQPPTTIEDTTMPTIDRMPLDETQIDPEMLEQAMEKAGEVVAAAMAAKDGNLQQAAALLNEATTNKPATKNSKGDLDRADAIEAAITPSEVEQTAQTQASTEAVQAENEIKGEVVKSGGGIPIEQMNTTQLQAAYDHLRETQWAKFRDEIMDNNQKVRDIKVQLSIVGLSKEHKKALNDEVARLQGRNQSIRNEMKGYEKVVGLIVKEFDKKKKPGEKLIVKDVPVKRAKSADESPRTAQLTDTEQKPPVDKYVPSTAVNNNPSAAPVQPPQQQAPERAAQPLLQQISKLEQAVKAKGGESFIRTKSVDVNAIDLKKLSAPQIKDAVIAKLAERERLNKEESALTARINGLQKAKSAATCVEEVKDINKQIAVLRTRQETIKTERKELSRQIGALVSELENRSAKDELNEINEYRLLIDRAREEAPVQTYVVKTTNSAIADRTPHFVPAQAGRKVDTMVKDAPQMKAPAPAPVIEAPVSAPVVLAKVEVQAAETNVPAVKREAKEHKKVAAPSTSREPQAKTAENPIVARIFGDSGRGNEKKKEEHSANGFLEVDDLVGV
ncbi:MAG: hypothetical protein PHG97_02350 [Candidatus Margulisbacteria bacterium]|nr:hypothetical protein [Candidatus Margulisiibacteriota bacterium]